MHRYIGLDAHASSCTLVVLSAAGKKVKEMVVETHGQALVEAVRLVPGNRHLVLEEGTQSAWLYEILERHVDELVVVPVGSSKGQKSDRIDAYNLAEALRIGAIKRPIFKAPRQFALLRDLARGHQMLVWDVVRVPGRIKSVFRSRGLACPGQTVYGHTHRATRMAQLPPASQTSNTDQGRQPLRQCSDRASTNQRRTLSRCGGRTQGSIVDLASRGALS